MQRIQRLRKDETFTLQGRQKNLHRMRMLRTSKDNSTGKDRRRDQECSHYAKVLFKDQERETSNKRMQKHRTDLSYIQKENR